LHEGVNGLSEIGIPMDVEMTFRNLKN
jgi:hypothetical protein